MDRQRRYFLIAAFVLVVSVGMSPYASRVPAETDTIPSQLTDRQFWKLSSDLSEPAGMFRSDNLVSNETWFQYVIPQLNQITKSERVYLGVGPEQNFTYITALKPKMAFIIDIRRGNLDLHLMYKALFDISEDRGEFVSRLFSRPRPAGVDPRSTAREIFRALEQDEAREELYNENLRAIRENLLMTHGFQLSPEDLQGIEYVYSAFYKYGPNITYSSSLGGFPGRSTYAQLMATSDASGQNRSYLANEENFSLLKDLQSRNLVIPVVGNFGGTNAIRAVAGYLKNNHATVSAFYLSNVEQYLAQDGLWRDFCSNAATLPIDESSTFIRSVRRRRFGQGAGLNSVLGNMTEELRDCDQTVRFHD